MSKKLNKHDRYVERLVKQIKSKYDDIRTHKKFSNKKRLVAEADIVARIDNEIHFYEVKCSYRIVKARKQLKRLKRIHSNKDVSCFFYCGISSKIIEVNC
ncbi:MAG: hypothetical protein ACMXX7_00595 [Candidatus Woesearchaeota archaeon]